jgi:hypothetical protein
MKAIFEYRDGFRYTLEYPTRPRGIYRKIKGITERPYRVTFVNVPQHSNQVGIQQWIKYCRLAVRKYDSVDTECKCKYPMHDPMNDLCGRCGEVINNTSNFALVDDMSDSPVSQETQEKISSLAKQLNMSLKAKTDKVSTGLALIPFHSLFALGKIFVEGLRYGKDNWKKGVGDKEYQEERLEHALTHLSLWKEGDRSEAHLAKVAWFCFTQLELERLEEIQSLDTANSLPRFHGTDI